MYHPVTKKNTQFIENIQRRATRIILELRGLSYEQRLIVLNLPTLLYRRQRHIFRIIHNLDNEQSDKYFHLNGNITI